MEIKTIDGKLCNVYVVKANKTIVVDAGAEISDILAVTDKVDYVFITHAHFDHIEFLTDYASQFKNAKFLMSKRAYEKLNDLHLNGADNFWFKPNQHNLDLKRVQFISEGDSIEDLEIKNEFVNLKGHTDCGMGLIIGDCLFSGDAVFENGYGRYDLPTGNFEETCNSLQKIKNLDVKMIYSGHGNPFDKSKLDYNIKYF